MYCNKKTNSCGFKNNFKLSSSSWLSTILIIILPKCPFCVMAYSGAMTLCSGRMLYPNSNSQSIYFILGLSLIVLFGIILNYKGKRTIASIIIALLGISLLMLSQVYWYSEVGYYTSVLIIMTAIWNNGSLHYLLSKIFKNDIINYSKT